MSVREVIKNVMSSTTYSSADTKNYEDNDAWIPTLKESFEQLMFVGSTGNTFYANAKQNTDQLVKLVDEVIKKLKEHDSFFRSFDKYAVTSIPESKTITVDWYIDTIIKARNEGFIRTAPIIALAMFRKLFKENISLHDREYYSYLFKRAFLNVIITGNDLEDFINITRSLDMGFGRSVKNAINKWIHKKLNEFYAIKYRNQIADAVRISHPYPGSKQELLDYVALKWKDLSEDVITRIIDNCPKIRDFEFAKIALEYDDIDRAINHIVDGNVPPTALIGLVKTNDVRLWTELMHQMGTMQLLKYLNKLIRVGVFDNIENVGYLKGRFSPENLQKAKILPFRLGVAAFNVDSFAIKDILFESLERYTELYDFSEWDGRWVIAPDISASMTARVGSVVPSNIAAVFSAIMHKGILDTMILPWDTQVYVIDNEKHKVNFRNVLTKISEAHGSGTYMELPVKALLSHKVVIDYLVIITDSEEWGDGWLLSWRRYKRFNPTAKAIFIRIDPYLHRPFNEDAAKKYDIYNVVGWSDAVFGYIQKYIIGKE